MGRHHKSKSSSHEKHKTSKPKRVSFGVVSSDNGPPIHSSRSSSTNRQQNSKLKDHGRKYNTTGEAHTTTKPHKSHASAKASSAKSQVSNGYKSYSNTSGILKYPEKHPKHPPKSTKVHPYFTLFSDSLRQRTTHLLTHLSTELKSILATTLQSTPQINISPSTNEPYATLAAAHKAAILAKYGNAVQLGVIRKFQEDCRGWDKKLKGLLLEHEGVQKELVELAREIGVGGDGSGGGARKQEEEDLEFEEMIQEIKQVGEAYVAKMDKLEKRILHEEARQSMLMMQAM